MNYFIDAVIAGVLIWGAYRGATKGFLLQIISLILLLFGIFGATELARLIPFSKNTVVVAFLILFSLVFFTIHVLIRYSERFIKNKKMTFADRFLGLFFGLIRYAFVISTLVVIFNQMNIQTPLIKNEIFEHCYLWEPAMNFTPFIYPFLEFVSLK